MVRDGTTLGPGFRFHPTDDELVRYYLKRKVTGRPFRFDPIAVVDVYKFEPWDLPSKSKLKTRDLEWYFFTVLDKKYGSGSRTNRATEKGYWKTTGNDRAINYGERAVGMKKTLVYHAGRAPRGTRSNWVMHEYRMVDEQLAQAGVQQDAFVLCRIFKKSGSGPKNGEKYGAPFIEEEWDDDDEVLVVPVPLADEPMVEESAGEVDAFFETDDLEKKLDTGVAVGSADLPSNFYYGECSRYPEPRQEFIKDQKPLVGTVGVFEPQSGQNINMTEPYAEDIYSVKDGENFELSHNGGDLEFAYKLGEVEQYLDATDHPLFGDGSFLETDDLLKPVEGNSTGADPYAMDIIDEYLAYSDDDITKYICFDSPQSMEGENPIPDLGPPFIQQNAEGDANDTSMTNKHDVEAHSSNEAAASKLVSENTNPFVKQANKWLASIPAPPAFAAEFPSKDIAIRIHSAPESSNSAHVTAGMVSITNITLRGNAMDWVVGKNGGFNTIISTEFSHPDVDSAATIPVSGLLCSKTAFVLSHGWVFLMLFSVLILSMSYKIGSFMHTGK